MSELDKDASYLRATLKEMATRLQYPGSQSVLEIVRDGRVAAAILLLMDRVDALEGKQAPEPETTPKFEDRSFIVTYTGETLCLPQDKPRAEAAGYEVRGTFQIEPGKNYLKLGKR